MTVPQPVAPVNLDDHNIGDIEAAFDLIDTLSGTAVSLLFRVSGLESCRRGVCCAKVRTLAGRMKCSERTVRRRFAELADAGLVEKVRRRCRTAWRGLTELGRLVLAVLRAGGPVVVAAHLAAHKGEAECARDNTPQGAPSIEGERIPRRVDPTQYTIPRAANVLSERAWAAVAGWLGTARTVSWARCRIAHRAFSGLVVAIHRSADWRWFNGAMSHRGTLVSADELVALAIEDAHRRGKDFGTVETAQGYIMRVVLACVRERRLPGEGLA